MKGIYCYIDTKNNSIVYVGKDSYIDKNKRHNDHMANSEYHKQQINKVLQNTPERYRYKVILQGITSNKILNGFEMAFIFKYNPKFNFTMGGEGALGYKHTPESIAKMSGKNHRLYGKKLSQEYKDKISSSLKGRTISKEHANKISQAMQGHKVTEATKQKMSKNHADVIGENNPKYRKDIPNGKCIYKEWKAGLTQKELSIKYNCSISLIQRRIYKYKQSLNT